MNNSRWSNASLLRSSESRAIHCRIQLFCSVPQAHGKSFAVGHSLYWQSQFCRGLFFRHMIKVLPCANVAHGNIKHSQNLNDKNSKKIAKTFFNRGGPYRPPLAHNLIYHYTTLTCVYTPFSFPTYYTKPSVNCLFEALNEFK